MKPNLASWCVCRWRRQRRLDGDSDGSRDVRLLRGQSVADNGRVCFEGAADVALC